MSEQISLSSMRVVALAGGVGGARLADGLARVLMPQNLTVIVNTGDDFEHLGLTICPDLDTICYTLAGIANSETGWGRAGETWHALESLAQLGGPDWFRLGDKDIGLHLERTRRLRVGQPLSQVTQSICAALGVNPTVLPMSDDRVSTWVYTDEGKLPFQEYFVHRQCRPQVTGFHFAGIEAAVPAPGIFDALKLAQAIVICPSNPWVSVDPILAVPGLRDALEARQAMHYPIVAISPIIGGKAVKGPAAKMYAELGISPSAVSVARHYGKLLNGFVLDRVDENLAEEVEKLGIPTLVTDTLMRTPDDRRRVAAEMLSFVMRLP